MITRAIYRVHFVPIQGLQSLLLVIKRVGEEAAALWEPGPWSLGPVCSPGALLLG